MEVAAALEAATYPPIVRVALEILGNIKTDVIGYDFEIIQRPYAAIDLDGVFFSFGDKPTLTESGEGWNSQYASYICSLPDQLLNETKFKNAPLIFQRTETGWRWIGQKNGE